MTTKRFKAAVIGGSGYGGAELIRRLLLHPQVELVRVASVDFIGEPLAAVHPNLEGRTELKFEGITPGEAATGMDIVLLGLPHKVSAQKMTELMATGTRVAVEIGAASAPLTSYEFTVGAVPVAGIDKVIAETRTGSPDDLINLGTAPFLRDDVWFDQLHGAIGIAAR